MTDIVNRMLRLTMFPSLLALGASLAGPAKVLASPTQSPISGAASSQTLSQNSVSLMLYHVVTGKDGKQYYLDRNNKPWKLPGAGVNDGKTLPVYTGSQGQRWYVDKTGAPIELPPPSPPEQKAQSQQQSQQSTAPQPVTSSNLPEGSFSIDNQVIAPDNSPQSVDCDSDSDSCGMLDETTAAQLGLTADALQAAADMAVSDEGLPYNQPAYWGGDGDPYWWGANGARNYLPRNVANGRLMRDWGNQQARYDREAGSPFGRYYGRSMPSERPAFAHPDSMTPFHSLFSEPMLSGGGLGDGRFTGRDTGRFTGQDTGRYTGDYTGRDTGRYTGDYTGRDTGRDTGSYTGRDSGRYSGRDSLGGLGALNGLRGLGDRGGGERMAPESFGGGHRGGGGRR